MTGSKIWNQAALLWAMHRSATARPMLGPVGVRPHQPFRNMLGDTCEGACMLCRYQHCECEQHYWLAGKGMRHTKYVLKDDEVDLMLVPLGQHEEIDLYFITRIRLPGMPHIRTVRAVGGSGWHVDLSSMSRYGHRWPEATRIALATGELVARRLNWLDRNGA